MLNQESDILVSDYLVINIEKHSSDKWFYEFCIYSDVSIMNVTCCDIFLKIATKLKAVPRFLDHICFNRFGFRQ